MPEYSFEMRFVDGILDGSKGQTIRRRRKRATEVGDLLTLYCGMRTKACRAICVTECVEVVPVVIRPDICAMYIVKNGQECKQDPDDVLAIAKADGFEDALEFFNFFDERYREGRLFYKLDDFEIVKWNLDRKIDLWHSDEFQQIFKAMSMSEKRLLLGMKVAILHFENVTIETLTEFQQCPASDDDKPPSAEAAFPHFQSAKMGEDG